MQSLALPSEITRLPNLTGYLKLPGPFPVARIELDYVKRPKTAPRFVPRTHAHDTLPDASASESPDPNADVQDALAPQSPEPNKDTRDVLVLVSPDAKPEEQVEPAPVNVTTNGTTDSVVAVETYRANSRSLARTPGTVPAMESPTRPVTARTTLW